jgi:hypothetical protein
MSNRISGAPPRPRMREVLALVLVVAAGARISAQNPALYAPSTSTTSLDPRWAPWLGCWQADVAALRSDPATVSVTCVVPLAGTSGVQQISITRGAVVSRRRFVADGRPNSFEENGCRGTRTVEWALKSRRVYMHSNYTCNVGLVGTSTAVLSLTSNGDWLAVERVRAGQGSIEHVDHWYDAGIPAGLPDDIVSALNANRLAISTARATAALALGVDDVLDALRYVEPGTVQSWIVASGQRFSLSGAEIATLTQANVPRAVLQAMVAWTPQPGAQVAGYDPDAYLNSTVGMNYAGPPPQVIVIQPSVQQPVVIQDQYQQEPMSPTYCTAVACYPTNQNTAYNNYPVDCTQYGCGAWNQCAQLGCNGFNQCSQFGCNGFNPYYPFVSAPIVTGNFGSPFFFPRVRRPFGVQPIRPIGRFPTRPFGRGPVVVGHR